MNNDEKIKKYGFVVEPFHCDFQGELTFSVLGNHLLNCASFHADEKGFGSKTIEGEDYTWVLSRLVIELEDMPRTKSAFSISTWIDSIYKMFTDRNYMISNSEGKVIGYVRTIWAMINKNTRQSADLIEIHGETITENVCDMPCPIDKAGRVRLMNKALINQVDVKYSDIDINGHTNSMKYIEHILDSFALDKYKDRRIRRLEMSYMSESYFGDSLSVYSDSVDDGVFDIEVVRNDAEAVCRCKLFFDFRV